MKTMAKSSVCFILRQLDSFAYAANSNMKNYGCKRFEGTPNKAALREVKRVKALAGRLRKRLNCDG